MHILIVEDSPSLAQTCAAYLEERGRSSIIAPTVTEALARLAAGGIAAVLLDLNLPDGNGMDVLKNMRAQGMDMPVIVMTADARVDTAVAAIRAGAQDFISKPVTAARLNVTLDNMLESHALRRIVDSYQAVEREGFCGFIGKSPVMQAIYRILENAAASKAPVFIVGESGTGKELAARAIHDLGACRQGPFEALNCAAIPATLMESEVFGHIKGAFTGAVETRMGAAARADGGTLFMDELTEMPVELQSKLLRFTQTGVFRPVGGGKEVHVEARFVSATNRDPLAAVAAGKLREDLYYRLNVLTVHLPPLRERGEDAALIAAALLQKMAEEEGKSFTRLSDDAREFLLSCPWPGNVRQLENTLRRAVVMNDGDVLTRAMIPPPDAGQAQPSTAPAAIMPLKDVERRAIEQALAACGGNVSEAARLLQINPSTIHRKRGGWGKS